MGDILRTNNGGLYSDDGDKESATALQGEQAGNGSIKGKGDNNDGKDENYKIRVAMEAWAADGEGRHCMSAA